MSILVVKFGGTSVASPERIIAAAAKVAAEVRRGHRVAVVVSAMSGVTNQLVDFCKSVSPDGDPLEYDTVIASGEQVTSGLMAIALQKIGLKARSFQGWQVSPGDDAVLVVLTGPDDESLAGGLGEVLARAGQEVAIDALPLTGAR